MLRKFSQSLRRLFNRIRGITIDEEKLEELLREFQKILIEADVKVDLALEMTRNIKERILKQAKEIPRGIPLNTIVLKALWDELIKFAGEKTYPLNIKLGKLNKILFIGLQGSGKTTTVAKLANWLKKRGYKVAIICADTWRPGAYDQLKQLADAIKVPIYGDPNEKNPVKIVKEGLKRFAKYDVVLIDTAGRHRREEDLMKEMKELVKAIKPDEVILVIDGMIGQQAYEQAKAFAEAVGEIGSIIVTKLDSAAKGGGAIAACVAAKAPIKFIGTGEKIEDFEQYVPIRFISRLLGIPDEKLISELSKLTPKQLIEGKFTLKDLKEYYESVLSRGGIFARLKEMIGLGISERELKRGIARQLAILYSMTEKELENPELLKEHSRVLRIARGSGTSSSEVRRLLKQYRVLRKAVRRLMRQKALSKKAALAKILEGEVDLSELGDIKELRKLIRWKL